MKEMKELFILYTVYDTVYVILTLLLFALNAFLN